MFTGIKIVVALGLIVAGAPALAAESRQEGKQTGIHRPVTSREIEELKRQIAEETRSSVEALFEYHAETGDLNNRLDFLRYGGRLNIRKGAGPVFYVSGVRTSYLTLDDFRNEWGTSVSAGVKVKPSDRFGFQVEAGGTRFSTDTTTIHALGAVDFKPSAGSSFYISASRSNVEETLLSAAGIRPVAGPFAGELVGRVMDNRIVAGGRAALPARFDLFAEGGAGNREGANVDSNFYRRGGGGLGYNLVAAADDEPVSLFRLSYALDYFGFDEDRLGFGGASLLTRRGNPVSQSEIGSDGISPVPTRAQAGIGGYFSPHRFLSNIFRAEAQGRPGPNLEYRITGFVGSQNFTGSDTRQASGFSGSLILRLTGRISLPISYLVDNFGLFTQQSLLGRLVFRF